MSVSAELTVGRYQVQVLGGAYMILVCLISYPVSIKDLLKKQDCKIFKKVTSINNHWLALYIPSKKVCSYSVKNNVPVLK